MAICNPCFKYVMSTNEVIVPRLKNKYLSLYINGINILFLKGNGIYEVNYQSLIIIRV